MVAQPSEASVPTRLSQVIGIGQIGFCLALLVTGVLGGMAGGPDPIDGARIGGGLVFVGVLFGFIGMGIAATLWGVHRRTPYARGGLGLAEILFGGLGALFFSPIAIPVVAGAILVILLLGFGD